MSLLFKVIVSSACSSTHHKLAMDALRHLRGPNADLWRDIFLKHYEEYLAGSKAPDDQFKDFKNHVLHVGENYWGGATHAARLWYDRTVLAVRKQYWPDVAYSAGVLSHYYSDPHMPFHTGQTEEEGKVHRAAEWSITKSFDELQNLLEQHLGGYPEVLVPSGTDWLEQMVREGAELAHPHYHTLVDHYDLAKGTKQPEAGLDQHSKDLLAPLLGHAAVGFARILERLAADTRIVPPPVELTLETFLAHTKVPVRWITKKIADEKERQLIERIFNEVHRTGKVLDNLPEDDRLVRELHAKQVLHIPLTQLDAMPARPAGMRHGTVARPKLLKSVAPILDPAEQRRRASPAKVMQPVKATVTPLSFTPRLTPLTGARRSTASRRKTIGTASRPRTSQPIELADEAPMDVAEEVKKPRNLVAVPVEIAGGEPTETSESTEAKQGKVGALAKLRSAFKLPFKRRPVEDLSAADIVGDEASASANRTASNDAADPMSTADDESDAPKTSRLQRLKEVRPVKWLRDNVKLKIPERLKQGFRRRSEADESSLDAAEPTDADGPRVVTSKSRRASLDVPDERPAEVRDEPSDDAGTSVLRHRDDLQPADAQRRSPETNTAPSRRDTDEAEEPVARELRFHLNQDQAVEAAPSIGPKMAKRFEAFGVRTVRDFLEQEAAQMAAQLNLRHIDTKMIRAWQAQTKLACRVPQLRGHDAQILVGIGVTEAEELAMMSSEELWELVEPFLGTSEAQRILRSSEPPDRAECKHWIDCAKRARPLKAA